jgi:hypothetical protein
VGATIDIIRAEGVPSGKMIVFFVMRAAGLMCPCARPRQPNPGTPPQLPGFGDSSGSLLASKVGSFLASAEVNAVAWIPESKTPNGVAEVPLTEIAVKAFRSQLEISGTGL